KRALATVTDMRVLEPDDQGSELWQRQPHRHLSLEHSAFALVRPFAGSFAGDDQCNLGAVRLGAVQKAQQRRMRLSLREAVQVEAGVNCFAPTRDTLLKPSPERRERWPFFLRRRFAQHRRTRRSGRRLIVDG